MKNPILFAIVIFPTLTMGALVMVKPNLRMQVNELLGWDSDGDGISSQVGRGVKSMKDTPVAVYEKKEEREIIQTIVSEGGTDTSANNAEDAVENGVSAPAAGENNTEVEIDEKDGAATGLIYSIGIRPHSS